MIVKSCFDHSKTCDHSGLVDTISHISCLRRLSDKNMNGLSNLGIALEIVRFYSILLHATIETLEVFKKMNENDIVT